MTQEQAHNTPDIDQKRKVSKGEQAFDFTVYGLMNWVGTFVITVPVAWWMMHGSGKPIFSKGVDWFERQMPGVLKVVDKVLSPIRKPPPAEKMAERARWWADKNVITFATFQGGNIMLLPIWLAERAKVPLVKATNKMLGDETDPATIEEAPKTDIWSLVKARLAAWGTVLFTFTALGSAVPKTFGMFEKEFGEKAARAMGGTAYKPDMPKDLLPRQAQLAEMGESAKVELQHISKQIEGFETKRFQLGKIASWDTVATTAAVILLYAGSKFFVQQKEKNHAGHAAKDAGHAPVKKEQGIEHPARHSGTHSERILQEKEQAASQEHVHAL